MSRIPLWTSLLPYITVLKWESNIFSLALAWPLLDFKRTRRYFVHHTAIATFLLCVTYYRASLLDVHGHGKPIIAFHLLLQAEPHATVVLTLILTFTPWPDYQCYPIAHYLPAHRSLRTCTVYIQCVPTVDLSSVACRLFEF
jgi:hypothetical protein